jgi:hypothetical protein
VSLRSRYAGAAFVPHPNDVRAELGRIAVSRTFAASQRCRALLDHLVRDHSNQKYQCGEAAIGDGVRSKPGFSFAMDLAAAVQLARLRNRLSDYYEVEGHRNPLRIRVPDDGYQVSIEVAEPALCA